MLRSKNSENIKLMKIRPIETSLKTNILLNSKQAVIATKIVATKEIIWNLLILFIARIIAKKILSCKIFQYEMNLANFLFLLFIDD